MNDQYIPPTPSPSPNPPPSQAPEEIKDPFDIRAAITKVAAGHDLTFAESEIVMQEIMSGTLTPAQIAAFLTAMYLKGESTEEVAACAKVMRQFANQITPRVSGPLLDTCGTGGDGCSTFNISTVSAIIAAAAGCTVAKHGNRAMSSTCGSADLLEALGVNIELPPEAVQECIEKVGIGFMYAPKFHPAMRFASPVRREIGIPTVFNVLGPLTNPASATTHVLGTRALPLARAMAGVLQKLGLERGFVVHGDPGLDELSLTGASTVIAIKDGALEETRVEPEDLGLARASLADLQAPDRATAVRIALDVLRNQATPAQRDVVLLNSAYAIAAARGVSPQEGLARAREVVENGAALAKLVAFVQQTGGTPTFEA